MPDARVTVTVHGPDPLSRAGVVRHLQHQPSVELVDRPRPLGDEPRGAVAVMLAERLDDRAGAELRRLVRGGRQRVVLIAGELRETELMAVMEYGVQAVLAAPDHAEAAVARRAPGRPRGPVHTVRRGPEALNPPVPEGEGIPGSGCLASVLRVREVMGIRGGGRVSLTPQSTPSTRPVSGSGRTWTEATNEQYRWPTLS
ncbi:hypothetical protein SANTM175S_00996 [Streptomyces antimycoticus]